MPLTPVGRGKHSNRGVSLVSVLIAVVIIGILGALVYPKFVGTRDLSIDNAKKANVSRLNELAMAAINLGATVGADPSNQLDISTVTTAIACLNTGFSANGVPLKLDPTVVNPNSYVFSPTPSSQVVTFDYQPGPTYAP